MNTKTFGEGTMLMLGDVIARIGCAAAMPNEHKSDWLANRFSLKPAVRIRLPGQTGTHLLWRAADVEKARKMWEAAAPRPATLALAPPAPLDPKEELKAMERSAPEWKSLPKPGPELARSLIDLAGQLLQQAGALIVPEDNRTVPE